VRVQVNDAWVTIPSSLSEITLWQRIEFQRQHGNELDEILKSILEMEEGFEKEAELLEYQMEKMFRTFSFFTGTTVEALKESSFINEISSIYYASLAPLFDDEDKVELQQEFLWNGEFWHLHGPELKNGDKMKFGELIDSKQIVKQMIDLGAGQWEYALPLCAIYLRKKDEPYQERFLYEGSARQEMMKELPMDIAMNVLFFSLVTVNIYLNTFQSSGLQRLGKQASTLRSTLINGVG
jgi:hypothetical protein